jgi:hypothetical protein
VARLKQVTWHSKGAYLEDTTKHTAKFFGERVCFLPGYGEDALNVVECALVSWSEFRLFAGRRLLFLTLFLSTLFIPLMAVTFSCTILVESAQHYQRLVVSKELSDVRAILDGVDILGRGYIFEKRMQGL